MASFENYNLPYNYTTYQNIKYPGLCDLFNLRLDPQFFVSLQGWKFSVVSCFKLSFLTTSARENEIASKE